MDVASRISQVIKEIEQARNSASTLLSDIKHNKEDVDTSNLDSVVDSLNQHTEDLQAQADELRGK